MNKVYGTIWLAVFMSAIVFVTGSVLAQKKIEPRILRRVESEKKPNAKIEAIVRKELSLGDGKEHESEYFYNFVDLNDDKKDEVLVYVEGFMNCGTGGCNALLLKQNDEGDYELLNFFSPVRSPIIVSESKTKGWKDLIFFNSGGGIARGFYSVCRFDGKSYPENPIGDDAETPRLTTSVKGIAYLASDKGIKISPKK